jgi:multidrug efflux pump subunit AcrA (membrane-fusion protein)
MLNILGKTKNFVRNHKRVSVILFGALVIAGVVFFRNRTNTAKTVTQTGTVERGTLVVTLSASGQVTAANSAVVATSATGVVSKVYVQNGKTITSGDPLLELELDQDSKQKYYAASASYLNAKNSLASAQNNLNTLQASSFAANVKFVNDAAARNLSSTDPTYIQENATWLAAENAYKNQQNAISAAQQSVSSSWLSYKSASPVIYAPISGVVNGLSLTVGSVISSQTSNSNAASAQRIASVVTNANPTITLNLTQIDAPKVKVGNRATVMLDAFLGKTYTGKVVSIDTVGSVSSNVTTYPTVIQLDTKDTEMYPNMSATANIILDTRDNVLLVPKSAIQTQNGQSSARVMKNGVMETVNVEVGKSSDTQTEIVSGLTEGETVVTSITTTSSTTTSGTTSVFSGLNRGGTGGGNVRIQTRN